jgi:HEAT repeat protein
VLKDNDPSLRTAAACVLGTMGDAQEVVSALAEVLKDQEVEVRRSAVQSLAGLKPAPPGCVRALIAALDDRDEEVARQAGAGLKTAQFSKEDVAALANVLRQGQPNGRASAASLFAALGPEAKAAKANLINALEDKDKQVRQQAAKALGNMKADAWDASKKLAALLDDGDRDVRRSAIAALAQIGPDAVVAVPQLIRMLKVAALHDEVSAALVKIGKKAVPGIVEKLSARDNNEKIEACRLLGEMGAEAADAIEALSALAHDRKSELPRVRKAAEEALKKIQR